MNIKSDLEAFYSNALLSVYQPFHLQRETFE